MDEKQDTLIVYIDFAKAFNRVSIPKLLYKLNQIGIVGSLFSCIRSLLSNRMQCAKIDNAVNANCYKWCATGKRPWASFIHYFH